MASPRRYTPEDYPQMDHWRAARGLGRLPWTPKVGYIVDDTAAGFLVLTDCDYAVIEGFVSNPAAPSSDRFEAFNSIKEALESYAKSVGIHYVVAWTTNDAIRARMVASGMELAGEFTLASKEL